MLLNVYLAATGAAIAVDAITWMTLVEKLKKEGYVLNKEENQSIPEKIYNGFATIAHAWWTVVPIAHIIGSLYLLSPNRMSDLKSTAKSNGTFVKSYDTMTREERLEELARRERKIQAERKELEMLKAALSNEKDFNENKQTKSL